MSQYFDYSLPVYGTTMTWSPIGFDGIDFKEWDQGAELFGKVTVAKFADGCSRTVWKKYPSLTAAKRAAQRLVVKLRKCSTKDEHNAVIDRWYR